MTRSPSDLPPAAPPIVPTSATLAEVVSEADNEMLRNGLKKLGVSAETLTKLKDLDGLAQSAGHFLSISLEKTHRMYFLQLVHLMELADSIRIRLNKPKGEEGYVESDEARAFFTKNYTDIVKEVGNGYKNMLNGAEAMVSMLSTARGAPVANRKKMGWRKVTAVEAAGGNNAAPP